MKILMIFLMTLFPMLFAVDSTTTEMVEGSDPLELPKALTGLSETQLHLVKTNYSSECPKGNVNVSRSGDNSFNLHFFDEVKNGFFFGKQFYIDISNASTTNSLAVLTKEGPKNCIVNTENQYTIDDTTIVGVKTVRENCNGIEDQYQENYKLIKNNQGGFSLSYVRKKKNSREYSWNIEKECNYTSSKDSIN